MKTYLEKNYSVFCLLNLLSKGYKTGNFSKVFPELAEDCVWESQWVLEPMRGRKEIIAYLEKKGETLIKSGSFPTCSIQELIGNLNAVESQNIIVNGKSEKGSVGLYYPSGELCLLMEQTLDDEKIQVLLRITLDDDQKISRVDICDSDFFKFRMFYTYVAFLPAKNGVEIEEAEVLVSEDYYSELYLFLDSFDEYGDLNIPINRWCTALDKWKAFYDAKTFDEAFEAAAGIDYASFSVKDESTKNYISNHGVQIWENRNKAPQMLEGLIEWTKKYKDICDHINSYGF